MSADTEQFNSWCILELMGHVRMAGRVTEEERFGAKMGRIDVPTPDAGAGVSGFTTVYFGGSSVYRLTPCTEEIARSVARGSQPQPVHRWELPAPKPPARPRRVIEDHSEDLEDDEERELDLDEIDETA